MANRKKSDLVTTESVVNEMTEAEKSLRAALETPSISSTNAAFAVAALDKRVERFVPVCDNSAMDGVHDMLLDAARDAALTLKDNAPSISALATMGARVTGTEKSAGYARAYILATGRKELERMATNAKELAKTATTDAQKAELQAAVKALPTFTDWAKGTFPDMSPAALSRLCSVGRIVTAAMAPMVDVSAIDESNVKERETAENLNTAQNAARLIMKAEIPPYNLAELTINGALVTAALIDGGVLDKYTSQKTAKALSKTFRVKTGTDSEFENPESVKAELSKNSKLWDTFSAYGIWEPRSENTAETPNDAAETDGVSSTNDAPENTEDNAKSPVPRFAVKIYRTWNADKISTFVDGETLSDWMKRAGYERPVKLKKDKDMISSLEIYGTACGAEYAILEVVPITETVFKAAIDKYAAGEIAALEAGITESMTYGEIKRRKLEIIAKAECDVMSAGFTFWLSMLV